MPNSTNGVRGGSSKRSDQKKNLEPNSFDSQGSSRRNIEEPQNSIDILAHSSGALQRLAEIALYFGSSSSFTRDMQRVEDDYGAEIAKEKQIRELKEMVETVAHVKSEETKKLQQDYKGLLDEREDFQQEKENFQQEKKKYVEIQEKREASRKKESEQILKEEKAKNEKIVKAKKAELEDKYSRNFRDLEEKCGKLSAANAELQQRFSEAEQTLKINEKRHVRDQKTLEDENEKLDVALKQWQAQFPVEGEPIKY